MKVRVISGAFFVAIVTGFFLLREFVDVRLFSIFLWFLSAVGSFEMARAATPKTGKSIAIISMVLGSLVVPAFCAVEYFVRQGFGILFSGIILLTSLLINVVILSQKTKRKSAYLFSVLDSFYPSIFLVVMLLINSLPGDKGFVAMLLTFVIAPFSDTFAYFVGSLLKGPKLCPKLSPKKTWSGAIGGTIGGAIGSVVVFLIFGRELGGYFGLLTFIILGLFTAVATIFGDLFESAIKRRLGIKDMGKIMPGHGGVLDRIDGATFASVLIYLTFILL